MYEHGAIPVELKVYDVMYAMNNHMILVQSSDFDIGGSYIHVHHLIQKYVRQDVNMNDNWPGHLQQKLCHYGTWPGEQCLQYDVHASAILNWLSN